jgi:hypothetical protein
MEPSGAGWNPKKEPVARLWSREALASGREARQRHDAPNGRTPCNSKDLIILEYLITAATAYFTYEVAVELIKFGRACVERSTAKLNYMTAKLSARAE